MLVRLRPHIISSTLLDVEVTPYETKLVRTLRITKQKCELVPRRTSHASARVRVRARRTRRERCLTSRNRQRAPKDAVDPPVKPHEKRKSAEARTSPDCGRRGKRCCTGENRERAPPRHVPQLGAAKKKREKRQPAANASTTAGRTKVATESSASGRRKRARSASLAVSSSHSKTFCEACKQYPRNMFRPELVEGGHRMVQRHRERCRPGA